MIFLGALVAVTALGLVAGELRYRRLQRETDSEEYMVVARNVRREDRQWR